MSALPAAGAGAGLGARTRRILASGALYGLADMLVLGVGGFLLLPLYTHALTQSDFGRFIAVKANLDLLTTVLHCGLVSAASRVYFDHCGDGRQARYMGGVLVLFGLWLCVVSALLLAGGVPAWQWLSPQVPAWPYLGWCLVLAALAFLSSLGTTWLRLEGQARAFAGTQLLAAGVLAAAAFVALRGLGLGMSGILLAIGLSSAVGALTLLGKLGRRPSLRLSAQQARETLHYALPVLAGLLAYFVLNRINTLVLQRHVSVEEVAVFGLAQQLAMLVGIASAAFGKALQPAVWGADAAQAPVLMRRMSLLLVALMLAVATPILLFAGDIVRLVAPRSYQGAHPVLLLLVLASFAYALSLASDTVLLYHRRPRLSACVTTGGAALSAGLGLWLIPRHGALGAAAAMLGAFTVLTLLSYALARSVGGARYLLPLLLALATAAAVAMLASWLQGAGLGPMAALGLKSAVAAAVLGLTGQACVRSGLFKH